jgi:membrane-associated phospholipid phosphatase
MVTSSPSSAADARFKWLALALGAGHLALPAAFGTLRGDHLLADGLLAGLPWIGPRALRFARAAVPFWIAGVLVDNQRHLLWLRGRIRTGDLMALERRLFPAPGGLSWPEWFDQSPHAALDLLAGFGYATYLVEFFLVGLLLFFLVDARRLELLGWSFLAANVIGLVIYLGYPAAPPWYVIAHGMGPADPAAAPSAAGAARFDALLGVGFFESFYSRNPNVFGAMPSLHVAYPVVAIWHVWDRGLRWRVATSLYALLIAFSAVYLTHHYVLDVLAGIAVALLACRLVWPSTQRALATGPLRSEP